jgi:hypothetical protein
MAVLGRGKPMITGIAPGQASRPRRQRVNGPVSLGRPRRFPWKSRPNAEASRYAVSDSARSTSAAAWPFLPNHFALCRPCVPASPEWSSGRLVSYHPLCERQGTISTPRRGDPAHGGGWCFVLHYHPNQLAARANPRLKENALQDRFHVAFGDT